MSAAPTPALIDTVDSFYEFVKANVLTSNAARKFGGVVDAQDWPPRLIEAEAVYLATLKDAPTRTRQSLYQPLMTFVVEWRWALMGNNIPNNAQAANRGDKYRINVQIMQDLLSAHNPGYTNKNQYSVAPGTNNQPTQVATPYDPPDQLWWTIPMFNAKQDRLTGMLYTAGQVEISSYAPVSANI